MELKISLLCVLLSSVCVVDAQIFASGSSVFLRMEFDLKRNQTGDGKCDQIDWNYVNVTTRTRLVKPRGCLEKIKLSDRMKMSENGSLEIHHVTREDSGKYKVEIHNTRGTTVYIKEYNVTVQVPVSDPVLDVRCLSNGSAVISCRIQNGSDPEYSLSVNGVTRVNSSSAWNVSEVIIESSYDPWNISCFVRNRISHRETNRTERNCPVPVSVPSLNVSCSPDGGAEIECKVQNGSDPVFSWSHDGTAVNGQSGASASKISLPAPASGTITCTVKNNVSNATNTTRVDCPVPVSDPVLEVRCLSNGRAVISCRVQNGSDPVYSLSVNGVTWGNSSSAWSVSEVITESSYDPWNISCSVRNRISHRETNRTERNCPVPLSVPAVNVSCEADGRARLLCTVEHGTDPVYNWEVNGKPVNLINKNTLYWDPVYSKKWNVSCTVRNDVSRESYNWRGDTCPVPVSDPVLEVQCLLHGRAVISCRVQSGSDPVYSLSVSGVTWGVSSSAWNVSEVITESSYDPWNISCFVRNRISHRETNRIERNCPALQGETGKKCLVSHLITTCFLCAAMTLLLVDIVRTLRRMDGTPEPGRPPRWKRRERTTSL